MCGNVVVCSLPPPRRISLARNKIEQPSYNVQQQQQQQQQQQTTEERFPIWRQFFQNFSKTKISFYMNIFSLSFSIFNNFYGINNNNNNNCPLRNPFPLEMSFRKLKKLKKWIEKQKRTKTLQLPQSETNRKWLTGSRTRTRLFNVRLQTVSICL